MFDKNLFKQQLIKLMNGRTTTEFAQQTGFNRTYLSKYLNLKLDRPPSARLLQNISSSIVPYETLLVSCGYLTNTISSNTATVTLPIVNFIDICNTTFSEQQIEGYETINASQLNPDYDYIYTYIKDNSMLHARIHSGDLVLIRKQSHINSGEIAVVSIDNKTAVLKRILKKQNILVLQSENPLFSSYIFSQEEQNRVRIIGKVIHVKFIPI